MQQNEKNDIEVAVPIGWEASPPYNLGDICKICGAPVWDLTVDLCSLCKDDHETS